MARNVTLEVAANCIRVMKENGTYRGEKVGRVIREFGGAARIYKEGEIVLFKEAIGERITVSIPLSRERIDKNRREGSPITTNGAIVNVPNLYVEEVSVA